LKKQHFFASFLVIFWSFVAHFWSFLVCFLSFLIRFWTFFSPRPSFLKQKRGFHPQLLTFDPHYLLKNTVFVAQIPLVFSSKTHIRQSKIVIRQSIITLPILLNPYNPALEYPVSKTLLKLRFSRKNAVFVLRLVSCVLGLIRIFSVIIEFCVCISYTKLALSAVEGASVHKHLITLISLISYVFSLIMRFLPHKLPHKYA
jgi:hypothetical protein